MADWMPLGTEIRQCGHFLRPDRQCPRRARWRHPDLSCLHWPMYLCERHIDGLDGGRTDA